MFNSNGDANFSKYANPRVDDLLAQGNAQSDPDQAISLYQQVEDIALEDMPLIPLYTSRTPSCTRPRSSRASRSSPGSRHSGRLSTDVLPDLKVRDFNYYVEVVS